jgi:flagellar hook assembly protein FlgD
MNPNPFAEAVGIRYGVGDERGGPVRLRIYDVEGRLLRTLIDGTRAQGTAEVWWDGRDDAGRAVAPGVYFVRLDLRGAVETAKLVRVQ